MAGKIRTRKKVKTKNFPDESLTKNQQLVEYETTIAQQNAIVISFQSQVQAINEQIERLKTQLSSIQNKMNEVSTEIDTVQQHEADIIAAEKVAAERAAAEKVAAERAAAERAAAEKVAAEKVAAEKDAREKVTDEKIKPVENYRAMREKYNDTYYKYSAWLLRCFFSSYQKDEKIEAAAAFIAYIQSGRAGSSELADHIKPEYAKALTQSGIFIYSNLASAVKKTLSEDQWKQLKIIARKP